MSEDMKQCPLCGKPLDEDGTFCENCQSSVDNQYKIDLLTNGTKNNECNNNQSTPSDKTLSEVIPPIPPKNEYTEGRKNKKKKPSKSIMFLILGCLLLLVVGIISILKDVENRKSAENEEQFWNNCIIENTPVSYAKYLVAFQNGKHVEEATKRIKNLREAETAAWDTIRKSADINDFYAYLTKNPTTQYIQQVRFLMDSLSWLTATSDHTADAYKAYIENIRLGNISGKHLNEATERYDYLSNMIWLEGSELDSLKTNLTTYFEELSGNKPLNILRLFAPQTNYFGKEMSNTEVMTSINQYKQNNKIDSLFYAVDRPSIMAQKDDKGLFFVDARVYKQIVFKLPGTTKKDQNSIPKRETVTDTLQLVLDKHYKITSINLK